MYTIWKLLEDIDEIDNIPEQKFKLVHNKYGNKRYESDLFIVNSYTHNPSSTSWKESGYALELKPEFIKQGLDWKIKKDNRIKFNTMKEIKEWLKTKEAVDWYKQRKK